MSNLSEFVGRLLGSCDIQHRNLQSFFTAILRDERVPVTVTSIRQKTPTVLWNPILHVRVGSHSTILGNKDATWN